jgi:uncharacterized membrane protein YdbT with pleckstrin-like domain
VHPAEGEAASGGVTAVVPPSAALLPAELIQPGEIIILLLKPSPWFILLEPLRSLATLAVVFAVASWLSRWDLLTLGKRELVGAFVALAGVRLFWQFLEWLGCVYVLTDRRVIRVRGVLRIHVFEAPLKNIQHLTVYFSVRERFLGLGTLGFATAGTGVVEAYWRMLAKPREVYRTVVEAMERYR